MAKNFIDALYGIITFDDDVTGLIDSAVLQRLRHVRLSNIDSVAMPGISGITRFEHVLGVAHLAKNVGFYSRLTRFDQISLQASALLHDWAITAFGHLVEEAFSYVGAKFDHEEKLYQIVIDENSSDIGGLDRQIFCGRETGLGRWATGIGGSESKNLLEEITKGIRGTGKLGQIISGKIDIDNIDNVVRMAYHMGLDIDRDLPIRLVSAITGLNSDGTPIFSTKAEPDIDMWLQARAKVYNRLMLSEPDFSAKLMILWATTLAYKCGEIKESDWNLTDYELIGKLVTSSDSRCTETIKRWLVGEFWDTTHLVWMTGSRPDYDLVLSFSEHVSGLLSRPCFAYCIKDKRDRLLEISFDDNTRHQYGHNPNQWLLGVGSSKKKAFTSIENSKIIEEAEKFFGCFFIGVATNSPNTNDGETGQLCLI